MPRIRKSGYGDFLILAPWWVNVTLAGVVYVGLSVVLPKAGFTNPGLQALSNIGPQIAPWLSLFCLVFAMLSVLRRWSTRIDLQNQESVDSLVALGPKEFENLTGEYFRREGFRVGESLGIGPDGGVDLRLRKEGGLTLVQCKRWKSRKVGLPVVRELLGAMTAEQAARGILITTSSFTREAVDFARSQPIDLIEGRQWLDMIRAQQRRDGQSRG